MTDFDGEIISIYPRNSSTITGMFYLLNSLYSQYGSRYIIEGKPRSESSMNSIDKSDSNDAYWSIDDYLNLTFTFDSPFYVTHYSIMNAAPQMNNSYPTSWRLYGIDKYESKHLIDSRDNESFDPDNNNVAKDEIAKVYSTRSRKAYSKYLWVQTGNSLKKSIIFIKHFEFFGTLCSKDASKCDISLLIRTCKIYRRQYSYNLNFVLIYCLAY